MLLILILFKIFTAILLGVGITSTHFIVEEIVGLSNLTSCSYN